ncbi:hypothetical protein NKJ46_04575 [Mesorhizobium sp. M0166]|uniref:hypothetical protein n=1 Tax=Mesorhizobium sp. M0166 TaxID=2956902 RepID=UPI00333AA093
MAVDEPRPFPCRCRRHPLDRDVLSREKRLRWQWRGVAKDAFPAALTLQAARLEPAAERRGLGVWIGVEPGPQNAGVAIMRQKRIEPALGGRALDAEILDAVEMDERDRRAGGPDEIAIFGDG